MSMCRARVGVLLTLAALGVCREVGGQAVGGGPVGAVLAYDMEDLNALGQWLGDRELRCTLDPSLSFGEVVTSLRFRRILETAGGGRVYLGDLAVSGGNSWSCVMLVQNGATSVVTRMGASGAPAGCSSRSVIPDAASLEFLSTMLLQPTAEAQQAIAAELQAHKLVELRVAHPLTARTPGHFVELYFDGDNPSPSLVVSGELLSGVVSNVHVSR